MHELKERHGSVIVFVKTKKSTEMMARQLFDKGFEAIAIQMVICLREKDGVF